MPNHPPKHLIKQQLMLALSLPDQNPARRLPARAPGPHRQRPFGENYFVRIPRRLHGGRVRGVLVPHLPSFGQSADAPGRFLRFDRRHAGNGGCALSEWTTP